MNENLLLYPLGGLLALFISIGVCYAVYYLYILWLYVVHVEFLKEDYRERAAWWEHMLAIPTFAFLLLSGLVFLYRIGEALMSGVAK